jgi:hypothetical protein
MPNFCIAEVFAVFEKYRWGRTWNPQVRAAQALTAAQFSSSRQRFRSAIHNGGKILQVALDRYHILAVDLISPINNAYKIKRNRKKTKDVTPAKTYDMLIVAMGIWLQQQYGQDRLTVVTGDSRLRDVVERAKSVKLSNAMRAHLQETATALGLTYCPELYPTVINLTGATKSALRDRFPAWTPGW